MSHDPKSYIRALVLVVLLVLPGGSAGANVLSSNDYEGFRNLAKRMLASLIDTNNTARDKSLDTAVCLYRLNENLDAFHDRFDPLVSLVGLASVMVDVSDEKAVIHILSVEAPSLLKSLEGSRRAINYVLSTSDICPQNSTLATAAAQKTLRIYDDAATLVRSIIKKIGTNPP
jgi:hypothetical protein